MRFLKSFIQIWGHIYQFLPNEYVCYRNATGKNPPSENDTAEWLVWSGRSVNIALSHIVTMRVVRNIIVTRNFAQGPNT